MNYRINIGEILEKLVNFDDLLPKTGVFLMKQGKIGKILAEFDNFLTNLG